MNPKLLNTRSETVKLHSQHRCLNRRLEPPWVGLTQLACCECFDWSGACRVRNMRAILPIFAKVSAQPAPRQLCWSCHPGFQDLRSPEWEVAGNRNSRVERVAARSETEAIPFANLGGTGSLSGPPCPRPGGVMLGASSDQEII